MGYAGTVVSDLIIAVAMCLALRDRRTGLKRYVVDLSNSSPEVQDIKQYGDPCEKTHDVQYQHGCSNKVRFIGIRGPEV